MRKLIYSQDELNRYPNRRLLGEENVQLGDLLLIAIEENDPRIKNIFEKYKKYGPDIVFGPVLNKGGRLQRGHESKTGIYLLDS